MIGFFALISFLTTFIYFSVMISNFNIQNFVIFLSFLISTILFCELYSTKTRSKRNEEEIKRLKEKLNLPDSVSKNKDNQNQQGEDNK